ncbi:MAG: CoA transferase [Caldilineaceae bacterium]|nr:CoA transferase [Caldilineaceae bacterium]
MIPKLLSDVRILAVEQFGAGPFGTLHLADLGAEVIKIENPHQGGDVARYMPPYTSADGSRPDSLYFQSFNRNKRSLTLDLQHPDGQQLFRELVAKSDAVFNNLRGDLPEKLGLRYDQLKSVNPRIVCCSLTGFGLTGPRQAEPAYDYLMQAYAGWMSLTGEPDGPPTKSGLSVVDYAGGAIAMLGLVGGLFNAQRTGHGCEVDVSLLDTAVSMLNYVAIWALNRDYTPQRMADSAHPTITPAQSFQTADGYLVIFCAKEKFWQNLVALLDAPELTADPRFATFATRYQNRDLLLSLLKPYFRTQPTAVWLEKLRGKVPCAPVNTLAEALQEEQILTRNMILEVDHPEFGPLKEVRTAIHIKDAPEEHRSGSALGADTEPLLRELLGYSEEQITDLRQTGVV